MLQHLFPLRAELIFLPRSFIDDGSVGPLRNSQRFKVGTPCWLLHQAPRTTLSQSELEESRHGHLGISGKTKMYWWKNLVIQFIQEMQIIFWLKNVGERDQMKRIIPPPLQVCVVSTRHDGCSTSSVTLLALMHPSLWNRVNLDSYDHVTFIYCFRVQSLCFMPFLFFIGRTDKWFS